MPPVKPDSIPCAGSLTPALEGSACTAPHVPRAPRPAQKPKESKNRGECL